MKSGAKKFDNNKPKLSLIPQQALLEVAKVFTFGAAKYGSYNHSGGFEWTRLVDANQRHVSAWLMNEDLDKESKLNHIAHAVASLMMLMDQIKTGKGKDDRNKVYKP